MEGIDGGGLLLELGQALGLVRIDGVTLTGTLQEGERASFYCCVVVIVVWVIDVELGIYACEGRGYGTRA